MKNNKNGKKHNKIGFTLIELLAVIVILAAIMLIIIPLVTNNVKEGSEVANTQNKESIELAAKNWASDNKNMLPEDGEEICVSVKALIQEGYLDNNVSDDYINGSVVISNTNGIYYYTYTDDENRCPPEISLYKTVTFNYKENGGSKANEQLEILPGEKVDISRKATKDGWEFVGWNTNKEAHSGFEEFTMPTKDVTLYAIYKKKVTATFTIQDSKLVIADATKKSCLKYNKESGCSITAPILTSIKGTEVVGWSADKDSTTAEIKSGSLFNISSDTEFYSIIKITDVTPPTCTLTLSGTKGNNNWYRGNVEVRMTRDDGNGSGVDKYGLTSEDEVTYNSKTIAVHSSDGEDITYYGYVKDMVGNEGKCSITFKRDATPPTCTIAITNNPSSCSGYDGRTWYKSNVNLKVSSSNDNLSGADTSTYKMDNSSSADPNNYVVSSDTRGGKYTGRVTDKAGNEGSCSITINRDTKAPYYGKVYGQTEYYNGQWDGYHYRYEVFDDTSGIYKQLLRHRYLPNGSWGANLIYIADNYYTKSQINEVAWNRSGHTQVYTQVWDMACNTYSNTREFSW